MKLKIKKIRSTLLLRRKNLHEICIAFVLLLYTYEGIFWIFTNAFINKCKKGNCIERVELKWKERNYIDV